MRLQSLETRDTLEANVLRSGGQSPLPARCCGFQGSSNARELVAGLQVREPGVLWPSGPADSESLVFSPQRKAAHAAKDVEKAGLLHAERLLRAAKRVRLQANRLQTRNESFAQNESQESAEHCLRPRPQASLASKSHRIELGPGCRPVPKRGASKALTWSPQTKSTIQI